jgi:ubiquinone/menaquinone biosynthesis C-methylase UbiE
MSYQNPEIYKELNEAQEFSETDPFTLDRYRQFFTHLPVSTNSVLDIGCNTGRGGKILKELNRELQLIGLDCVESRLEKLSDTIYSQKVCSYSTNIQFPSLSIDAIVAGEFIEHLYPEDVDKTLQEFYRLLKPTGRLLLTTPNPNYLRLKLTGGSVLGGAHVSQHYWNELKKKLEEIGFGNIKILGSGKMTRLLGENFPMLALYGSYLVIADKVAKVYK